MEVGLRKWDFASPLAHAIQIPGWAWPARLNNAYKKLKLKRVVNGETGHTQPFKSESTSLGSESPSSFLATCEHTLSPSSMALKRVLPLGPVCATQIQSSRLSAGVGLEQADQSSPGAWRTESEAKLCGMKFWYSAPYFPLNCI
ncbi:hypothetical protein I7I53_02185 [Histoplasma capsulatum var. duboisii H88]|uniref:Uncharacterized protein n=1 Tax=Ajellomyces capsulatus (strain H88) TaxID=544711 RepID=A0A8A1LL64_AJEC8|nr:hypothetical protein I7I53_02185 [Histoplasma capsulatum var. duboisii H88]